MVGNKIVFESEIEGDLWTISKVWADDTLEIIGTETWRRIVE